MTKNDTQETRRQILKGVIDSLQEIDNETFQRCLHLEDQSVRVLRELGCEFIAENLQNHNVRAAINLVRQELARC